MLEWQRFWYQKNQLECMFHISITLLVWLVYNSWVLIPQFPGPKSVQTAPASVMPDAMRDFLDIARHPSTRAPWTQRSLSTKTTWQTGFPWKKKNTQLFSANNQQLNPPELWMNLFFGVFFGSSNLPLDWRFSDSRGLVDSGRLADFQVRTSSFREGMAFSYPLPKQCNKSPFTEHISIWHQMETLINEFRTLRRWTRKNCSFRNLKRNVRNSWTEQINNENVYAYDICIHILIWYTIYLFITFKIQDLVFIEQLLCY